jgi:hypothetical protein
LSIRADEFEAEAGVLPSPEEQQAFGIGIVQLSRTRHMDLTDQGPAETKKVIARQIIDFLQSPPARRLEPTN